MKKFKINLRKEKKEVVRKVFYVYCPLCDREIKGTNPKQVSYNLKLHMEKCKKLKRSGNGKIKKKNVF